MNPHPYDAVDLFAPVAGIVVEEGRGALPFHLIHGESLVAAAAWAVGEAGVDLLDQTVPWAAVVEREEPLLLHDPLCPMTPPEFLRRCAERAAVEDRVVVGVRPVTDTVKEVHGDLLGTTVDRDALVAVCSPVVLPAAVVADLLGDGGRLPTTDFTALVSTLRQRYGAERVLLVEAPPEARRIAVEADLAVLEALTDPR
ncbi:MULTISPECIES: 2-C-methyl-D-erythritol 4-phosphate cytidylyltransferase [unclassified Nocardioides]|uniref:2-C-methyl-D-erythritol 4-phosphate cytidylyltransferase n=1 Tax=unclassified Nocardioides TaxID=2615069 RepID=UPI0011526E93|nr:MULTISPECIES: 2-C-methyl-D-erythritol 4-phosphate cytidylyltransferase [unclassified Nocardioides]TQK72818.1 2-C-methyl-D-erythritol 4-phosphate cytidylyltransferase [Nocardioides sp. SLBN-35]WGY02984.1 2-C-methyl-D-erythritol 4-phosphate cytidylyltransferase [Nocardioides sp. QY071]